MTLGDKLARLRKENNFTQEQLAELLGVSRQAISKWESNSAYPETEKLIRLGKLYNCSMDYLLLDEIQEQQSTVVKHKLDLNFLCFERVSQRKFGNLPLWHINIGPGRVAKGVFALGIAAKGIVSVGLVSVGVISLGVLAVGLLTLGVLSAGLISIGAIAAGILTLGAIAVGVFSIGSLAIGRFTVGALAIGSYAAMGDTASAAVAIGFREANGTLFQMLTGSWSAWHEHRNTVNALLDELVPWYLSAFKKLFLWFCQFI